MATPLRPDDLVGFAQEYDASDSNQKPLQSAASREAEVNSSDRKKRLPRDAREIAFLQAQLAALTLQLKTIKQARAAGTNALLMHGSYWRTEDKVESKQRLAAQEENERLRAHLRAHRKIAARLMNMMKRRASSRILQTLDRYEHAAKMRYQNREAAFDQAFSETDVVLAAADLLNHSSTISETRHRQKDQQVVYIQFRRRTSLPCDMITASEAVWNFRMHEDLRKHFTYEHIEKSNSDNINGYTCRFRPRHSQPGPTHFRGDFMQRRYMMEDRVVIVRKFHVQDSSAYLPICGRGYIVIKRSTAELDSPTLLLSTSWFSPDSPGADLDAAQQDSRFLVLMDFLKRAFESYAAFTKQLHAKSEKTCDKPLLLNQSNLS